MSAAAFDTSHSGYLEGDVVLGKYVLTALLARGGVGAVWRGRNDLLATDVAIKIIVRQQGTAPSTADEAATLVKRAHAEACLAAQLRHPAVCQALDFGVTEHGDAVIVSELLRGEPLDKLLLLEGRLETTRALQLLLPIVDALGTAHAHGVVHRDVKPSNIFLARDASGGVQPKLLDFGIARVVHDSTRITCAGSVCGTPEYMSPEQARGCTDVDARSDLWSICVTLYELVSGRIPFAGENWNAVMFSVINEAPLPLTGLSSDDAGLVSILERGLAKRREERFQTASELTAALSGLLLARGVELDLSGRSLRVARADEQGAVASSLSASAPPSDFRQLTDVTRITHTLESASAGSVTPAFAPEPTPRKPLHRAGVVVAVLMMALGGFGAGLLYRSTARAAPPMARTSPQPASARILVEPAVASVQVHPQQPPAAASSSNTAPQARAPAKSGPARVAASGPPVASAAAPAEQKGAVETPRAANPHAPAPLEASPSARANRPNALGYDFGL